ncbi:hypothetical protein CDAR_14891 [Caerostris darwini]|uniref:Uncharacterized protein n=1 Tax=Caerostris darwini TaxID=1538125 RepID=A0AAV4W710_9ARAC|nr:hypothetical protein CDAR_14891 [Caerostris darwini]
MRNKSPASPPCKSVTRSSTLLINLQTHTRSTPHTFFSFHPLEPVERGPLHAIPTLHSRMTSNWIHPVHSDRALSAIRPQHEALVLVVGKEAVHGIF